MSNPLDLFRQLEAMPEYKKLSDIRQFSLSLTVFTGNTVELRKLLDYGKEHYDELWNVKNRPELDSYQIQVVRYLHNFVAAAKSLVDHSRRFYQQNYQSTGQFTEYEIEVKLDFADNPLAQFVNCLRQYCQHFEAPPIGCDLHWDQLTGISHTIFLQKSALEEFDSWNSAAKTFLRDAPEQIDLYDVTVRYERIVNHFYAWVQDRLKEIHAPDVAVVEQKRKEAIHAMGPSLLSLLSASLQIYSGGIGQPEDIFLGNIDATVFRSICKEHSDPMERAKAMIREVEQYIDVTAELQSKILEAFAKRYQP